jgi:hypothetical protein
MIDATPCLDHVLIIRCDIKSEWIERPIDLEYTKCIASIYCQWPNGSMYNMLLTILLNNDYDVCNSSFGRWTTCKMRQ